MSNQYIKTNEKCVCTRCIEETDLQDFILRNASSNECHYCGDIETQSVAIDILAHYIMECWSLELDSPEDAGIPYISREGGWQAPIYHAEDLLTGWEYPDSTETSIECENRDIIDDLVKLMGGLDSFWATGYGHDEDRIIDTWWHFKEHLRHRTRFMLFHRSLRQKVKRGSFLDIETPLKVFGRGIEHYGMIKKVVVGQHFYRVRKSGTLENYNSVAHMGPPEKGDAKKANRMSPVGIPMFYGGLDRDVCLLEVDYNDSIHFAHIAKFTCLRPMILVDFSKPFFIPSIYSPYRENRSFARFISEFLKEMTKPLISSQNMIDHIEYIPTQAVAEWLRYGFRIYRKHVDGILYKSSKGNGICCVLFVENEQCVDGNRFIPSYITPILKLESYECIPPTVHIF